LPLCLHLPTSTWTNLLSVPAAFEREVTGHETLLALERWHDLVRTQARDKSRLKRIASHRRCARRPQNVVRCEEVQDGLDILAMKSVGPSLVKLIYSESDSLEIFMTEGMMNASATSSGTTPCGRA
jgi:hypothetical protein